MKSNICEIKKDGTGLQNILEEVEKVSVYNNLNKKQSFRLRLLAEELTGMLPSLIKNFEGIFWVKNEGPCYELHVELKVDKMSAETREELISVSKSRKNAAAIGIMGRIRAAAEEMILYTTEGSAGVPVECLVGSNLELGNVYAMPSTVMGTAYIHAWTLGQYKQQMKEENKEECWDELERSIVAKLADDVIVGVKGRQVDIIIKKTFEV